MTEVKQCTEDEIDIREIFRIIWSRKFWIISFVFIVCAITVFIVLRMKNVYESTANLKPQNVDSGKSIMSGLSGLASMAGVSVSSGDVSAYDTLNTILNDTTFISTFVKNNKFEKKVIKDYDKISKDKKFKDNINFIIKQSVINNLSFTQNSKTSIMTLSYKNEDRFFSKQFVSVLLGALSAEYRNKDMYNIQQQIDKYKEEINRTADITLKNKLADVVTALIQNKIVAQSHQYYGFDVITFPTTSDPLEKVGPKRSLIVLVACFLSFFTAVFGVILINYIKELRSRDTALSQFSS